MEEQENYYTYENKTSDYFPEQGDNLGYDYEANYKPKRNPVFGIVSLACGVASLALGCICCCVSPLIAIPVAIVIAIVGIVMFIIDKKKNGSVSALSLVGLIVSIVSLSIFVLYAVLYIIAMIVYLVLGITTMIAPSFWSF